MTNSRAKGARGELELSKFLTERGHEARRGQQFKGTPDSPDIECESLKDYHIECKRVEALRLYPALKQAEADSGLNQIPVVFHRKSREKWVVILDADDFLNLVDKSRLVETCTDPLADQMR